MKVAIQCENIKKIVNNTEKQEMILEVDTFNVNEGEQVVLMGPSGSGKTTLLHLLAGLENPSSGRITIFNEELSQLSEKKRDEFRGNHIGIVFQEFQLFPYMSAMENILVQNLASTKIVGKLAKEKAVELLKKLGLAHRKHSKVSLLSKGEQQRVAIARALLHNPKLLLVDEPTSSLDVKSGMEVVSLLKEICKEENTTLLLVTHDPTVASEFARVEKMDNLNKVYATMLNEVNQ
jgi:putative ABC transport system ATP-binding protein